MSIVSKQITDSAQWESFMATREEANFLHSWWWGDFHESLGHRVVRSGIYKDEVLVGVLLMIIEDTRRGRQAIVPAGPILDWQDTAVVKAAFDQMKQTARELKCIFIRVRPQLLSNSATKALFVAQGFTAAPMFLHAELTWQLDLTKDNDELLAGMRKKARYELKQAQKQGLRVEASTDVSKLDRFYEIQLETAKRHNFVPFSKKFLTNQFETFAQHNNVLLFEAYHEKTLLAQAFVIYYGKEAAYHYGASTEAGRRYPGAYLAQWEAIQEAKGRGMKRYNFWGVTKPEQTEHRFYGVSVFKRGFGGEEIEYLHAQDFVVDKLRYQLTKVVELVRKKKRHL